MMPDSFETELEQRLTRLSEAVPVDPARHLDQVVPAPLRGPTWVQRRTGFGAAVPALAVLAVAALLAGALKVGPSSPAATGSGSQTPPVAESLDSEPAPVATDRDGDFELTLRAGKARYTSDEPIDVSASLTYLGSLASIEIDHDSGGPILFGIREKVFGQIDVTPVSLLMCRRTTLDRNLPLQVSFKKSGGFSGDSPDAKRFKAWILDPAFHLPVGTWHLYASAQSPCMGPGPQFSTSAEIVIVVSDHPAATPGPATGAGWSLAHHGRRETDGRSVFES
jgi:hypothetical protein